MKSKRGKTVQLVCRQQADIECRATIGLAVSSCDFSNATRVLWKLLVCFGRQGMASFPEHIQVFQILHNKFCFSELGTFSCHVLLFQKIFANVFQMPSTIPVASS